MASGYGIVWGEPLAAAVRRIAREQVDAAVRRIERSSPDDPKTVHEFRKACKRVRSLLRLFRGELEPSGAFHRENGCLRDIARTLSPVRDADVALASYDLLMKEAGRKVNRRQFAPIRAALTRRRREMLAALGLDVAAVLETARRELLDLRARIDDWPITHTGFDAIRFGLNKTYRRAYRRRQESLESLDIEIMHEWRKRTKYHRQHLRLIRFLWPPLIEARHLEADRLGELLGDERDLRLLRNLVAEDDALFGRVRARDAFVRLIDARVTALRREAFALGNCLFAETPATLLANIRTWWDSYEAELSAMPPEARTALNTSLATAAGKPPQKPPKTPRRRKISAAKPPLPIMPAAPNGHGAVVGSNGAPSDAASMAAVSLTDVMRDDADLVRPGREPRPAG